MIAQPASEPWRNWRPRKPGGTNCRRSTACMAGNAPTSSQPAAAQKRGPFSTRFPGSRRERPTPQSARFVRGDGGSGPGRFRRRPERRSRRRGTNRHVAIKVLAPYFASSRARGSVLPARGRRRPPWFIPTLCPFIASICGKGCPISSWRTFRAARCKETPRPRRAALDVKEVLRIGHMQAASGLAAARPKG